MKTQSVPCEGCGQPVIGRTDRRFCSPACRQRAYRQRRAGGESIPAPLGARSARETLTCATCQQPMGVGGGSLPQGQARCLACRRLSHGLPADCPVSRRRCVDCGSPCRGEQRCRPCANRAQIVRATDDRRVQRRQRERSAPGLTTRQRETLLAGWVKQACLCSYCGNRATTIDHVVPLVRGGTNSEGNLAPCCKSCNSRKGGRMVIEWRTGRRLPPMAEPLPWAMPAPKRIKSIVGESIAFKACTECGALHAEPGTVCSVECRRLRANRWSRERYEPKVREPRVVACVECGTQFEARGLAKRCSKRCVRRAPYNREARRRAKAKRRARARSQGAIQSVAA